MELKRIFKYRNLWIGVAMVWIVFFHSAVMLSWEPLIVLKEFGYAGVDICLFASGIGCYYSLEKDPDYFRFLKRRAKRLAPVYYCFIIPWLIWKLRSPKFPLWAIPGNLLGIQTFFSWDYHFNWYIGGLVLYYLAIPLLKKLTDRMSHFWQDMLAAIFIFVLTTPFWGGGNTIVMVSRLPVLYAGIVCAKMAKQGHLLKAKEFVALGGLAGVGLAALWIFRQYFPGMIWSNGMDWYPFALIVPGLCVGLSVLAEQMERCRFTKWINTVFITVGIYSFEVYLIHVFFYESFMYRILKQFHSVPANYLWLLSVPVIACGTFLLNRSAKYLTKIIIKTKRA